MRDKDTIDVSGNRYSGNRVTRKFFDRDGVGDEYDKAIRDADSKYDKSSLFNISISEVKGEPELKKLTAAVLKDKKERSDFLAKQSQDIKRITPPNTTCVDMYQFGAINFEKTPDQKIFTGNLSQCLCVLIYETDPKSGKNKVASISHIPPQSYCGNILIDNCVRDQFGDFVKKGGNLNNCKVVLCGVIDPYKTFKKGCIVQQYIYNLFENSINKTFPDNKISIDYSRCNIVPIDYGKFVSLIVSCSRDGFRVSKMNASYCKNISSFGIDPVIDESKFLKDLSLIDSHFIDDEVYSAVKFALKRVNDTPQDDAALKIKNEFLELENDFRNKELYRCESIDIDSVRLGGDRSFCNVCRNNALRIIYPNLTKLTDRICRLKNVNNEVALKL